MQRPWNSFTFSLVRSFERKINLIKSQSAIKALLFSSTYKKAVKPASRHFENAHFLAFRAKRRAMPIDLLTNL